jgi:hypothetical protein
MINQQHMNLTYFADCVGAARLTPALLFSTTVAAFAIEVNEKEGLISTIRQVVVCGKEQCVAYAMQR